MSRISIGGEIFTISRNGRDISTIVRYSGRTLTDCYARPSHAKISIYNQWLEWATQNNVEYFGIASYNSQVFTLQGYIEIDDTPYIINITPCYNTLYPIAQ